MNCALWSAEVFEDDDGSLKNVHMAVLRGKQLVRHLSIPVLALVSVYICCTFVGQTITSCRVAFFSAL